MFELGISLREGVWFCQAECFTLSESSLDDWDVSVLTKYICDKWPRFRIKTMQFSRERCKVFNKGRRVGKGSLVYKHEQQSDQFSCGRDSGLWVWTECQSKVLGCYNETKSLGYIHIDVIVKHSSFYIYIYIWICIYI